MSEQPPKDTSSYETALKGLSVSRDHLANLHANAVYRKALGQYPDPELEAHDDEAMLYAVSELERSIREVRDTIIADFNSGNANLAETKARGARHGFTIESQVESAYRACLANYPLGAKVSFWPSGSAEAQLARISVAPRLCLYAYDQDDSQGPIRPCAEIGLEVNGVIDYELFPIAEKGRGLHLLGITAIEPPV